MNSVAEVRSGASTVLDLTGVLAEEIGPGHGLSQGDWKGISEDLEEIAAEIAALRREERLEPLELPYRRDGLEDVLSLGAFCARKENLVLLGSGGSSTGARAILDACFGPFRNMLDPALRGGPRIFTVEGVDPDSLRDLQRVAPPSKTVFHLAAKSGDAVAALVQFGIVWGAVAKEGLDPRDHIAVTADSDSNPLREIATSRSLRCVSVPVAVGERFSAFTATGLAPAVAAGIDPAEILDGAVEMDERLRSRSYRENPGLALASVHFLLDRNRGKSVAVMMPYAERLQGFADWFCSLWAGCLGKALTVSGDARSPVGQTPMGAIGPRDQNDLLQVLIEGPNDKMITLIGIEPRTKNSGRQEWILTEPSPWNLAHLANRDAETVCATERLATEMALRDASRPVLTIQLPELGPRTVGQLLHLYHYAAIAAGMLYHVNPFDRPGVDAEQRLAHAALGRVGEESLRARIEAHGAAEGRYRIR